MANKTLPISATQSLFLPIRNTIVEVVALAGAAATSVIEFFDGTIDSIATYALSARGTGYVVGDLVTLVAGEYGNSESRAVFRVTEVDNSSASSSISSSPSSSISSSVSTSPSTSISSSPSNSMSRSTSISSSISTSPSTSISSSPSTSISSSPSPSASASTSISSSPSPSASASTSISSSPSSSISSSPSTSPSTSISSSPSVSPSPSGAQTGGAITGIELISAGGGYTAGNVYATTSNGAGSGATIRVITVEDTGVSIAKLQCVANESAPPIELCTLTTKGVSVRISGTGAKGHITYA